MSKEYITKEELEKVHKSFAEVLHDAIKPISNTIESIVESDKKQDKKITSVIVAQDKVHTVIKNHMEKEEFFRKLIFIGSSVVLSIAMGILTFFFFSILEIKIIQAEQKKDVEYIKINLSDVKATVDNINTNIQFVAK